MGPLVYTSGNLEMIRGKRLSEQASMGPLVYTSGNPCAHQAQVGATVLQWGRWFTPAETGYARRFRCIARRASMGPLVYTSGNDYVLVMPGFTASASMGPLVYTSGNPTAVASSARPAASFNGAAGLHQRKLETRFLCPDDKRRFNGAAGLHQRKLRRPAGARPAGIPLQWGRWFTPAETGKWPPLSCGQPPLQWGRWFTPAETSAISSVIFQARLRFNGAAGLHQRKPR